MPDRSCRSETTLQVSNELLPYLSTIEKLYCSMNDQTLKVALILGSTRPGRNGEAVSQWVYEIANRRSDANFELVDIKDFNLPLLDEPIPPSMGQYSQEHTKSWS